MRERGARVGDRKKARVSAQGGREGPKEEAKGSKDFDDAWGGFQGGNKSEGR